MFLNGVRMPLSERDTKMDSPTTTYRAAVTAAAPNAPAIVDLHSFICPSRTDCIEEVDGVPLRPDGLHYEGPGADIVSRWLLTQTGVRFS